MTQFMENQAVYIEAQRVIEKSRGMVKKTMRDQIVPQTKYLTMNFQKVCSYGQFFISKIRENQKEIDELQALALKLDNEKQLISEQAMFMKDDWKREQEITIQLQKELETKDDRRESLLAQSQSNKAAVMNLNSELVTKKAEISSLKNAYETRQNQSNAKSQVDHAEEKQLDFEKLERLLAASTGDLEQALFDLSIFEQTCQRLEAEKIELVEELETARQIFDQREEVFMSLENLSRTITSGQEASNQHEKLSGSFSSNAKRPYASELINQEKLHNEKILQLAELPKGDHIMKETTHRATFNLANVDNYIDKITELTEGECGTRVSEITHKDSYQRVTVNNVTDSIVQKGRESAFWIQAPACNESNRQSLKLERGRKDADQEFFQMTLISQIMNHEKQKQLIEMQSHHEQLFKKCVATGQPFYTWHEWIANHINGQV